VSELEFAYLRGRHGEQKVRTVQDSTANKGSRSEAKVRTVQDNTANERVIGEQSKSGLVGVRGSKAEEQGRFQASDYSIARR
jgi:hypothetical protein